ncbi:ThiF family adenylyltransferase [Gracilibacillus sp. YIM 98692]|uniref:ThiF family adenylyltransferase n=1 Tax=Gracilibacillus sp. YIM 98692 TaxID=2663532 RepID=UPI0013D56B8A|nr:ThiF family adenylyltransferase [Gracilibacillus sp. YIM 98692]
MIDLLRYKKYLPYRSVYPFIIVIGTGGTGGYLVQHIAQMMSTFNVQGQLLVADPDIVEEKNLKNQLFTKRDIGKKKANVLADRYRRAYQIPIRSYSEGYIEDVESLKNLFNLDYLGVGIHSYHTLYLPVIIGAVDNNFTRQVIHQFFESTSRCLYIDVGNESATVPSDYPERRKEEWTQQERQAYDESGWIGQVICGLKFDGETILPPVGEVFPDVLADKDDIAPSQISCSDLTASDPQRVLTNKMASMSVLPYLNSFMEEGVLYHSITFFNAQKGYINSQEIPNKREE